MYTVLFVLLLFLGGFLLFRGLSKGHRLPVIFGGLLLAATPLFFGLLSFLGELLWFDALGYAGRFWREVLARAGIMAGSALLGGLALGLFASAFPRGTVHRWRWPVWAGALAGGLWGGLFWDVIWRFFVGDRGTGIADPILGRDVGFYLFSLPFYDALVLLFGTLAGIALLAAGSHTLFGGVLVEQVVHPPSEAPASEEAPASAPPSFPYASLFTALGLSALVLAFSKYLSIFHLMYSRWGSVYGAGWLDVNVRRPAYYVVVAGTLIVAGFFLIPPLRRGFYTWAQRRTRTPEHALSVAVGLPLISAVALYTLALIAAPWLLQWLKVAPNEISLERPYLAHNIRFTRLGFNLGKVEERQFPVQGTLTRDMVKRNARLLSEVRLWDPRALEAVFSQFQEIRLYYEMDQVDIDRYHFGDKYRQVMVSAREIEPRNLPAPSQTFVNLHFKYTHGYGLALTPVSEFHRGGLPNLLIKDIPPVWAYPELRVDRSEIYYGERTTGYVIVNSREPEFDYPRGEENAYTRYKGRGGVQISNLWRKFLFGWKFGGTRLLMSSYPTSESRIQFHRQIRERVRTLAPFLNLDRDAYLVVDGGRLYWILDGYTTSRYFPYSEPFFSDEFLKTRGSPLYAASYLAGANYIRNSVKAVIDAYEGTVSLYVFAPDDPIIKAWSRIFPGLFHPAAEMPAGLRAHVRYPEGFLLAQGLVYAKYHMTDPDVFYNQEDLWMRATEKYYHEVQPVDPYYIMWKLPGAERIEFVQMLPFTPKNRQVLIGWIAGLSDGDNYGRLIAYQFPKEKRVLGTQQVDAKIDQDPTLSAQMTLWDQRHSRVIRGNVLVIPIEESLLYVEPIYLQAEAAAYPELRLVVLMQGDRMSYAPTFDEALERLITGAPPVSGEVASRSVSEIARQASDAFHRYLKLQAERRYVEAARELQAVEQALAGLVKEGAPPKPAAPTKRPAAESATQPGR